MRLYYGLRVVFAMLLAAAGWISIRAAWADAEFRRGNPESVAKAVALAPANTEYLQFRALQLDYEGADPAPLLERAVALNPMSSAPRIRLGLLAETRGDYGTAEKWLLDAASVDRQFEPRWTLANFYFRRENAEQFWKWIRAALEVSYGDRRPSFDLCWRMSSDADEIFGRAIPENHDVLAAYVGYLLENPAITRGASCAGVHQVAMKLAAEKNPAGRDLLLAADDALIAQRCTREAWELWRMLGFDQVSFESPRVGQGFDWRRIDSPGVVHLEIDQPRPMHRISFSGSQPESCELLKRVLKLDPGRRYTLEWQSQPDFSGVEWRIGNERAPLKNGSLEFTASSDLMTLALVYQRPKGEVRREGSLEVWGVAIR